MAMEPGDELDLEARRLCPDGGCIGVLDDSGVCKECGRLEGREGGPYRGAPAPNDPPAPAPSEQAGDERELCPDGACIGLIGADGRCRECGRPRESA